MAALHTTATSAALALAAVAGRPPPATTGRMSQGETANVSIGNWQHYHIGNIGNWQHCPRGYLRRAAWAAARRAIGTRNGEQLT